MVPTAPFTPPRSMELISPLGSSSSTSPELWSCLSDADSSAKGLVLPQSLPQQEDDNDDPRILRSIDEVLDYAGFGSFHLRLTLICSMVWAGDAMEILLLSFLTPALQSDPLMSKTDAGVLGAVTFAGILVGNYVWGLVSDRYGRRPTYLALCLTVAFCGTVSALSTSLLTLCMFRLAVGFGLGASPGAFTLVTEYLPGARRAQVLVLASIFWSFGAILGSAIAWWILPAYGWRWYLVACSMPMWGLLFCYPLVPESPHFLLVSGRTSQAEDALRLVLATNTGSLPFPTTPSQVVVTLTPHSAPQHLPESWASQLASLLKEPLVSTTLPLWVIWFVDCFAYYGVAFLTPRFFIHGSENNRYSSTFISTLAEFPGVVLSYILVSYLGRRSSLVLCFILSGVALAALVPFASGSSSTETPAVLALTTVALFLARTMISASFNITYIYTTEVYPTVVRTTALGGASAIARVAGMTTAFVSEDVPTNVAALIFCVSVAVAAIAGCALPVETANKNLKDDFQDILIEDMASSVDMQRRVGLSAKLTPLDKDGLLSNTS